MRTSLVVGGLAVLAAAVVLVVMLVAHDGKSDSASATKTAEPAALPASIDRAPSANNPSVTVTDRPRGETQAPADPTDGENPREYAVGDSPVRDHRAGDNKPLDIPPNSKPADARLIPSSLTHEISGKVKAVMKDCVASIPKEGRGAKPRLEGQIVIAIKDKILTVTQSTILMRDLEGLATEAENARKCVESHAVGLSTPATDEADLASYTINPAVLLP